MYQTIVTGMVKGPTLIRFNLMKGTCKTRLLTDSNKAPLRGKQ